MKPTFERTSSFEQRKPRRCGNCRHWFRLNGKNISGTCLKTEETTDSDGYCYLHEVKRA